MNTNNPNDTNVATDENAHHKEDELKAQIIRDQEYLFRVVTEETIKRQEIRDNLKKFHEMVDEKEDDIKEEMEREYLTDSKMMLEKINAFKKKLK